MRADEPEPRSYHLRCKSRAATWATLSWRIVLAFVLIGITVAVHWFDRDGLRQNSGEPITFADVLYFTMITVTTVGYGEIVPVIQQARMFDTFVVTPIRLFVWLIFLGTAYNFLLRRVWERWRSGWSRATASSRVFRATNARTLDGAARPFAPRRKDRSRHLR